MEYDDNVRYFSHIEKVEVARQVGAVILIARSLGCGRRNWWKRSTQCLTDSFVVQGYVRYGKKSTHIFLFYKN
jgi:hypothetical protein